MLPWPAPNTLGKSVLRQLLFLPLLFLLTFTKRLFQIFLPIYYELFHSEMRVQKKNAAI